MIRRGLWLIAVLTACISVGNVAMSADADMAQVLARIKALEEKNAHLEGELKNAQAGAPARAAVDRAVSDANDKMGTVITAPEPGCNTRPLKIGGYLDTTYQYNFNRPDNQNNNQRIFDTDSNGFNVHLAELSFDRLPTEAGQAGFHIDMALGTDPRIFAAQDTTGAPGSRNAQFEVVDLKQAFLEYKLGVGCGNDITIDMGKFVTWMGAEVIEASDDMNSSRSFLFGDAIPFTHTGVRATYTPFKDKWTVGLGVANANDFIQNPMNSPTGLFMSNWTPVKWFNWTIQGSVGNSLFIDERQRFADATANPSITNPNALADDPTDPATPGAKSQLTGKRFDPSNQGQPRGVFDTVMTFTPFEKFTFVINADYGTEGEAPNEIRGVSNVHEFRKWYGAAGYVKYQLSDRWYVAGRYEYFADPEGARTGFRQDLQEGTITTDWALSDPLHIRFEYRHDMSNIHSFSGRNDINNTDALTNPHPFDKKSQDTFMMQWLYKF
jgi:hypothetical protein